jgi:hypothetical protein
MRSHHDFCAAIERANLPLEQIGSISESLQDRPLHW